MKILFAASENAWGGFLGLIRSELPQHHFEATGRFEVDDLKGFEVLIPTMSPVTEDLLEKNDRLRLIQQCGSGLEGVDLQAARKLNIWVANVPADISGNADSVVAKDSTVGRHDTGFVLGHNSHVKPAGVLYANRTAR